MRNCYYIEVTRRLLAMFVLTNVLAGCASLDARPDPDYDEVSRLVAQATGNAELDLSGDEPSLGRSRNSSAMG